MQNRIDNTSEPIDILFALSTEIEKSLAKLAKIEGLNPKSNAYQIIEQLHDAGKIGPNELYFTFMSFWEVRNIIVHGSGYKITKAYIYETVEIGIRLLRMINSR